MKIGKNLYYFYETKLNLWGLTLILGNNCQKSVASSYIQFGFENYIVGYLLEK